MNKCFLKMCKSQPSKNKFKYVYPLKPYGFIAKEALTRRLLKPQIDEYEELMETIEGLKAEVEIAETERANKA